jgi:peptide/nickel transport system permease protein
LDVRLRSLIGRRLAQLVPVLFGVTLVTFALLHLTPGDPAAGLVTVRPSPQLIAQIRHQLGIDRPLWHQYLSFLNRTVHGNLGYSFRLHENVNILVRDRLPTTLELVLYACVLAVVLGVPLAVLSAVFRSRWPDHAVRGLSILTLGLPAFWVGVLLVNFVALKTGLFPTGGAGRGVAGTLWHLFLPALTLALTFLAVLVRSLRASLIEVLEIDFVGLARLKGITRYRLYCRHVLRNAISPALTVVGLNMSYLLGASVVTETVFSVNGIGYTLLTGVLARDYQLVQGIALVFGALVILVTLGVDVLQALLDPRRSAPSAALT